MSTAPTRSRAARRILLVDAAAEAILAAFCLLLASGLAGTDAWSLPYWLGPWLLVVAAVVLACAAGALCWLARHADPAALRAVAIANTVTLVLAVLWAVAGLGGHGELRGIVLLVAAVLACLAAAQLVIARR